ncbi:A/G-specific adenine glycosylase [Sporanaerobium hydrogeniformans]|uniref:A/G-specific adenine glycosylase n=1 Tax=Sporanaerobium hydrogeniformans TaxID=3072179 RepID=A0AC61DAQ9_9FIRM|nr:A/G-specific adenine glycosylase [Sporanaerobium hydrogeniformans]PHV69853.1 A/G-specific adenine glycosylase [Sporanaerobium hydrogeniformans]
MHIKMDKKSYAHKLLRWFDTNKRQMPWRETRDPYAIWVSEVMLQQTQVNTVIPYYIRFMERFPNPKALAEASLEEVHHYWQGLGYYRRAENLQKGAQLVSEKWGGQMPKEPKEIREIPGIGPYTLGAICSIAYGIPLPAVDGNVMRILARQFCISDDIGVAKNRKIFEDKVMELMPEDPNRFNQALMELGAVICTPQNPECTICPVASLCEAHRRGEETLYPIKRKKIKVIEEAYTLVLLKKENKYGLEKRPEEGLLAQLWGIPMIEASKGKNYKQKTNEFIQPLEPKLHVFSHRKWQMEPIVITWSHEREEELKRCKTNTSPIDYFTIEAFKKLPIGTAFKKILDQL